MGDYDAWTWDACRERFYNWGMQAEFLMRELPETEDLEPFQKTDQHFKNIMHHMLPVIDALEESPDLQVGDKIASHYALHMGLHPNLYPSQFSVTVYWDSQQEKYQIGLNAFEYEEEAYVSFVEVIPTIRRYLLRLQEIENEHQNTSD